MIRTEPAIPPQRLPDVIQLYSDRNVHIGHIEFTRFIEGNYGYAYIGNASGPGYHALQEIVELIKRANAARGVSY